MDGPIVIAVTGLIFNLTSIIRPVLACELTIFCTKNILLFLFLPGSGDKEKPLYDKDCQDDIEGIPQKKGVLFHIPKNKNIF